MRSNLLTLAGLICVLVFLGLLTSWKWSGLAAGIALLAAGYAANDVEVDEIDDGS